MSKGGSRWGAGRPAYRVKSEHLLRLDIREIRRRGLLQEGVSCGWAWSRGGVKTGSIGILVGYSTVRLNYSANSKEASQVVWTTSTSCPYGGSRQWFACPVCHRRCEVLFMRSGRFACRTCQRVSYTSQSGSESDRVHARYHKLHALVENGKPKWQRWATFNRLEEKFERADQITNQMLWRAIQRLTGADGSTLRKPAKPLR